MVVDQGVRCGCCGEPIAVADRMDIRAHLPEAALDVPEHDRLWATPGLLQVMGVGSFARCLLPVQLSGDLELVIGTWMQISDDDLDHAAEVWEDPKYVDLVLHGTFANAIKPWADTLGKPVTAIVHDPDEIPYIDASDDPGFERLLTEVWDRDEVLSRFAHALPVSVQEPFSEQWSLERSAGMAARINEDGVTQFGAPGRSVFVDQINDQTGGTPDEILARMLEPFPELPAEQVVQTRDGEQIRHARWLKSGDQHEFYGYAVKPGSVLALVCIHDDPADHAWARHVFNSVRSR